MGGIFSFFLGSVFFYGCVNRLLSVIYFCLLNLKFSLLYAGSTNLFVVSGFSIPNKQWDGNQL